MLRDRLIIWEYAQRPSSESRLDPSRTLRDWAEPYTSSLETLLG